MSGFSSSPFEEKGNHYSNGQKEPAEHHTLVMRAKSIVLTGRQWKSLFYIITKPDDHGEVFTTWVRDRNSRTFHKVAVDMNYFHPSEMSVKVIDNTVVVVEAKHKERADDQYGCISRHFLHRYRLPNNVDPTSITSDLSDKGILTVTAKKVHEMGRYMKAVRSNYGSGWACRCGAQCQTSTGMTKKGKVFFRPILQHNERGQVCRTRDNNSHQEEVEPAMEFYDESDYIFDDYEHSNPDVFYSVTRTPGKGFSESEFKYFECGCNCPGAECTVDNKCSCLKFGLNYKPTDDGLLLVKEKFENVPVFECNLQCSCLESLKSGDTSRKLDFRTTPGLCPNRNIQFGPIDQLEVFSAGEKGLGLKTNKRIVSGSFICEYAGEVISLEEAKKRQKMNEGMNYIFILREFAGDKLSGVTCVDPTHMGNIGRYINHSCEPNSAIVPVRVNDVVPWLCVFAVRDIEENEEICYDYSGVNEVVTRGDEKLGRKPCFCNSVNCKKFLPFQGEI